MSSLRLRWTPTSASSARSTGQINSGVRNRKPRCFCVSADDHRYRESRIWSSCKDDYSLSSSITAPKRFKLSEINQTCQAKNSSPIGYLSSLSHIYPEGGPGQPWKAKCVGDTFIETLRGGRGRGQPRYGSLWYITGLRLRKHVRTYPWAKLCRSIYRQWNDTSALISSSMSESRSNCCCASWT